MKSFNWRIPVGVVVLVFGVLALLQTLGVTQLQGDLWGVAFALIFAATGGVFLYALAVDRQRNWWAAIPGCTLVGLGAIIAMGLLRMPGPLSGFVFLASISAAFWVVYFILRQWWAIIPAGVMASVALTALLGETGSALAGGILFVGMAATFALLALVGVGKGSQVPWPWFPAIVLFVMGAVISMGSGQLSGIIWAVVLILGGGVLILRPYLANRK